MATEDGGPGPPDPCSCSTCEDDGERGHTFVCFNCGYCFFRLSEEVSGVKNCDVNSNVLDVFKDIPGKVVWLCPPCLNQTSTMRAMKKDSEAIHAELNSLTQVVHNLAAGNTAEYCTSPRRKAPRIGVSFDEHDNPSITALKTASAWPNPPHIDNSSHCSVNNYAVKSIEPLSSKSGFKINLKKIADSTTSELLKELHIHRKELPVFSGRRKKDGSHDVLFKSYEEACKAKDVLDKKLSDFANISNPQHDNLKNYRIVGLEFEMSIDEITDSIIRENSSWLKMDKLKEGVVQIKGDPNAVMYIRTVSMCRNKEYRMVNVSMSPNMVASIGRERIALGYVKCKLYEVSMSSRCFKCQQHGHFADKCNNKLACPRCSHEHKAEDCSSHTFKCVNCTINGKVIVNHPSYSSLCPYNNINK